MEVKPEHFRQWESLPDMEAAMKTAGEKLRSLAGPSTTSSEHLGVTS
jgi:hypothetical protein